MTNRYRVSGLAFCALLLAAASAMAQQPITYQGQLKQSGTPFTGTPDLEFRLYDSLTGGTRVGATITRADWPVADGLFQVELDFGAGAFGPDPRWLEIVVDGTVLSPRQRVRAAPMAMFALEGNEGPPGPQGPEGPAGDSHWIVNGTATAYLDGPVGIGFTAPPSPLAVRSEDEWTWNAGNGRGDFHIGDGSVGLSMGVALGGGGRGVSRIWTNGGVENLLIGSAGHGATIAILPGQVGINTTGPTATLDIDGAARIRALSSAGAQTRTVRVDQYGNLVAGSRTRYTGISPVAFKTAGYSADSLERPEAFSPGPAGVGYAGIQLPDDAVVTELRVWLLNDAQELANPRDVEVTLHRCPYGSEIPAPFIGTTDCEVMANVYDDSPASNIQLRADALIDFPEINNETYSYFVRVACPVQDGLPDFETFGCDSERERIHGVRIRYRVE